MHAADAEIPREPHTRPAEGFEAFATDTPEADVSLRGLARVVDAMRARRIRHLGFKAGLNEAMQSLLQEPLHGQPHTEVSYSPPTTRKERRHERDSLEKVNSIRNDMTAPDMINAHRSVAELDMARGGVREFVTPKLRRQLRGSKVLGIKIKKGEYEKQWKRGEITYEELQEKMHKIEHASWVRTGKPSQMSKYAKNVSHKRAHALETAAGLRQDINPEKAAKKAAKIQVKRANAAYKRADKEAEKAWRLDVKAEFNDDLADVTEQRLAGDKSAKLDTKLGARDIGKFLKKGILFRRAASATHPTKIPINREIEEPLVRESVDKLREQRPKFERKAREHRRKQAQYQRRGQTLRFRQNELNNYEIPTYEPEPAGPAEGAKEYEIARLQKKVDFFVGTSDKEGLISKMEKSLQEGKVKDFTFQGHVIEMLAAQQRLARSRGKELKPEVIANTYSPDAEKSLLTAVMLYRKLIHFFHEGTEERQIAEQRLHIFTRELHRLMLERAEADRLVDEDPDDDERAEEKRRKDDDDYYRRRIYP